jgi:hypothetical protein
VSRCHLTTAPRSAIHGIFPCPAHPGRVSSVADRSLTVKRALSCFRQLMDDAERQTKPENARTRAPPRLQWQHGRAARAGWS